MTEAATTIEAVISIFSNNPNRNSDMG